MTSVYWCQVLLLYVIVNNFLWNRIMNIEQSIISEYLALTSVNTRFLKKLSPKASFYCSLERSFKQFCSWFRQIHPEMKFFHMFLVQIRLDQTEIVFLDTFRMRRMRNWIFFRSKQHIFLQIIIDYVKYRSLRLYFHSNHCSQHQIQKKKLLNKLLALLLYYINQLVCNDFKNIFNFFQANCAPF